MFQRKWYQVEQLVKGVHDNEEQRYLKVFTGTIRECRRYVTRSMGAEACRVLLIKTVMERDGKIIADHEEILHRARALMDVRDVLAGHFDDINWGVDW